jgi:hypothetical protein
VSSKTQPEPKSEIVTETQGEVTTPQTIIEEQVSSKTQPDIVETIETEAEGPVQKVTESGTTAFNEGVESVQQTAKEYRDKIAEEQKQKQRGYQPGRVNPPALSIFERVSKMMADAYQSIKKEPTKAEVKKAYDALVSETKKQYEFIKEKGLKVIKHEGVGEPYADSQEMLRDIRENNTLKFLPNDVAFGEGDVDVSDNIGLQSSGIKLEDGYELTNSEVFRIVHDYFGHGILGNQFGAIGEENATLQHLDLYSDEAAPAVIFQTRGQNSWVNFSGVNKEANDLRKQARELRKQGKTKEADKLVEQANKLFKFAEPKIAIFPTKFNFKRYETARRINEQETIDSRPNRRANVLSKLLETYSKKSSGTRGVNKRSVQEVRKIGIFDLNVIAEYTLDNKISEGIKFKGVQKIYEVTDGDVYRKMMEESLKDNPYAASVTVHSAEKFNGMRMFVTEDGSTGITLTKEGFLGGAFSNPNANRPQNLAQLMILGIKEGATTAEAFDTILPDYYSNFGFKAVSRTAFNEEFKPMIKNGDAVKDWDFETYKDFNDGRPDVVFFIYDGGNRNTIEDRLGLFDLYQEYEKENTESFDKDGYEQAEELMKQQAVKRLEFELAIDSETEVTEQTTEMQESTEPISQRLNEQDLPGYDRMMGEVEGIVEKSKKRRVSEAKTADNVMSYVMGSKVYENATDVQREALVRDIRKRFGLKEKAAPSVARLFGKIKDVKKITMTEKVALKKQIRDLGKGAKQAVKAQKLASQQLSKDIKELSSKNVITVKQAANIITKFSKVNLLNEMSVSNFVDYMAKVFADAEYDNKIKVAKSKLSKARKNIATKIGIADGLMLPLKKLFAINPSLIPDSSLERYLELLDIFSASRKVLNLEQRDVVKADVDAILNEINNEQSRADALAEIFNNSDNRVFDNGELDYAASLKNMIKEGDITNEDAEVMRKYKQDILPQVEKSPLSEEEIAEKKEEYIKALKQMTVSGDGLPSQDERNLARNLAKLISDTSIENLMKLGVTDLKNLLKVADNINNDYLPHYAQIMVEKINAINNAEVIADSVKKAKPLSFTSLYSKFKAAIMRSQRGGIAEMVRRNPLFYIDQVFGDFKTKNIFDALFAKTAEAEASFKSELKKVQTILENAEAKVAKSFKLNPDETLMSKFKMMTYMIQLEYESNVGSQQVNPAAEYLKATIKHIDEGKSRFGERDANMLQEILNKYLQDGQIDNEKLFNSFNKAEKDAIKAIRGINESLKDKAQYTAAIIRGDAIDPLNNYVHLNVLHDTEALDVSAATDFLNQANDSRRPSTKAKSLISRTKGAKPLNFDIFASAQRGAKFVLLDYNLTEPIRTARRAMNQATKDLEADGRIPKQQREIKNAIDGAFEEAVTNLLTNSILQNSLADEAIDFISKQGYRAVLAGTGRFAAELTSNITFAVLADPKAFSAGIKYKDIIMSTDGPKIMENVNSKQTNRNYPSDTLSGKFIDTSILSQASGIQSASSKNPVFNKMQQIWNLTGKKYQNFVELTADTLISTPDKLVMRPMWFGSFANEFKKITGTDVDFEKIASNDQAYMDANKDAIEQSKNEADSKSVMTGATDNSFMGILKGTVKPNQSLSTRAFNNFNNYMTRFLIFEYVTARTAIYAMVGNGALSKRQGAAMLAAVATRMTVYTLLSHILANTIMGLFGIGDEEEEDEKSLMQKIGQSLTSTFVSLLLGRDFGNATKLVINYGVEEVNEKFLDFLREGDYDPYKDGIAYSIIPRDGKNDELGKLLMNMGGSFGPALNTASLIYKNRKGIPAVLSGGTTKKEMDAIIREERVVKERIPLEVLGHFGLIPLYKDVRKSVNTSIYASIKEAERAAAQRKREAEDLLGGYDNKTDLERYNPRLYEKNFGKGSEWYESTKEEREAKLKKAKEEREMKDRIYNYTEKDGFGSKKFTGKKSSKKKSSGFGSKKFGAD